MSCIICDGKIKIRKMADCFNDYENMSTWLSNVEVLSYYGGKDQPLNYDKAYAKYSKRIRGEEQVMPLILEYEGIAIGYMQYFNVDDYYFCGDIKWDKTQICCGIDMFIGDIFYLNKGIGMLSLKLLLNYLFMVKAVDSVYIDPQVQNIRAVKCYEKCGFKAVGIIKKRELFEGEYRDNVIMTIHNKLASDISEYIEKT